MDDLEKQIDELQKRLKVKKAIDGVKLYWPGDNLTDKEKTALRKVSNIYLGEGSSLDVLFACTIYRTSNLDSKPKEKVGRGRPKGSKDYAAKILINKLAVIYERRKDYLPSQYQSEFGRMIEKIAKALNVQDSKGYPVTWNGHVNEILGSKAYARLRKECMFHRHYYRFFEDAVGEAEDDEKWRSIDEKYSKNRVVLENAMRQVFKDFLNKLRFEEEIKKIPGSDSFNISVKTKYSENSD